VKSDSSTLYKNSSSAISLDDANVIRRLKNHVVQCKCCQEALRNEDGLEANQPTTTQAVTATTANGDRSYNGN
jgi:hypothetical protein